MSTTRDRADRCPGVFRPWPAEDGALVRLRAAGGRLPSRALVDLVGLAETYGDGVVHVTARANLQLRALPLEEDGQVPGRIVAAIEATGLLPSRSHELARNIMASPQTGLAGGRADLRGVVEHLDRSLCADTVLAGLPGRFLFVLDDGRGDLVDRTLDLGVVAVSATAAQLRIGTSGWGPVVALGELPASLLELARAFLDKRGEGPTAAWHVDELDTPLVPPEDREQATRVSAEPLPYGQVPGGEHVAAPGGVIDRALAARLSAAADEVVVTPWRGVLVPAPESSVVEVRGAPATTEGSLVEVRGAPATSLETSEPPMPAAGRLPGFETRASPPSHLSHRRSMVTAPPRPPRHYSYVADGPAIYLESFATIRREAHLDRLPASAEKLAVRMIHGSGQVDLADDLVVHPLLADAGREALVDGRPVLADSRMVQVGITAGRLPAGNEVLCFLTDRRVADLAREWRTTRTAAAVSLWEPYLAGAVVAIGNAPTALFHLLEMILAGAPRPAAIIGCPVGFVGAIESKEALASFRADHGIDIPFVTVRGRRGGSAMTSSAVNALAQEEE
jgi:precorrin isomerase